MSLRNEGFSCRMEGGNKHKVGWSQLGKNAIDKGTIFFLNLNTFQEKSNGLELGQEIFNARKIIGVQCKQLIFKLMGSKFIFYSKNFSKLLHCFIRSIKFSNMESKIGRDRHPNQPTCLILPIFPFGCFLFIFWLGFLACGDSVKTFTSK